MKKKLIIMALLSMMTATTVGCGSDQEEKETSSTDNTTNKVVEVNKEEDKEASKESKIVKLTKDDAIKMNSSSIAALKAFFEANGMPYKVGNTYNKTVDEAEICLYDREVEENNIDTKNVKDTDYYFMDDFTMQASISFNYTDGFNIEDSLIETYCKAVTNEDIDMKELLKKLQEYMNTYNERSGKFLEQVNSDKFVIEIKTTDNKGFIVNVDSTYEVQ